MKFQKPGAADTAALLSVTPVTLMALEKSAPCRYVSSNLTPVSVAPLKMVLTNWALLNTALFNVPLKRAPEQMAPLRRRLARLVQLVAVRPTNLEDVFLGLYRDGSGHAG